MISYLLNRHFEIRIIKTAVQLIPICYTIAEADKRSDISEKLVNIDFFLDFEGLGGYDEAMKTEYKETNVLPDLGFQIEFVTMKHNSPPHWHQDIEILFILNGSAVILMKGEKFKMEPLDFMVIDGSIVHEAIFRLPQTMGICIHISKSHFRKYLADIDMLHFSCILEKLHPKQQDAYIRICTYLKDLTVLYFQQKESYALRTSALIMSIMAEITDAFTIRFSDGDLVSDVSQVTRIRQVFQYVEEHYKESISLQDAADELGLNREYFCRFFKKNTGMSFLQYVNQVRMNHIYQDLLYSEGSIQEILENNGVFSSRGFYGMFKKTYGCTPRELRKMSRENKFLL